MNAKKVDKIATFILYAISTFIVLLLGLLCIYYIKVEAC